MATLEEAITESFYAWEVRGRGWMTAPYAVDLEPPFRPLFLLPQLHPETSPYVDDGRRPTIGSRLVGLARSAIEAFVPRPTLPPPEPFVEAEPFPAIEVAERVTFRVLAPEDAALSDAAAVELLRLITTTCHPVSFEVIGAGGAVHLQLSASSLDAPGIRAHLEGFVPGLRVEKDVDLLGEVERSACVAAMEIRLGEEFFLPLRSFGDFAVDPLVPLVGALARARSGECLALQVIASGTRNRWPAAIHDALDDGEGGCVMEDAPWFLKASEKKTETPLVAVALRVVAGAGAGSDDRTVELLRSVEPFLAQFGDPRGNTLVPFALDGYAARMLIPRRESCRTGMLLSLGELAGFFHLPGKEVVHPALLREDQGLELPAAARGRDMPLGVHEHRGREEPVTVEEEARFSHTWVIGGSGTGKSTFLANLILEDLRGTNSVVVLDPHGDLVDDVLARVPREREDDVIVLNPADTERPVPLSVLDASSPLEENLLASDLVGIMRRLSTSWGDAMSTVLGEAVLALLRVPGGASLVDLRRFLLEDDERKAILARIDDEEIHRFWERQYPLIGTRSIGPLLTRLDGFLRMPLMRNVLGAKRSAFQLSEAMDTGKVVLARLAKGEIGEENAYLLGSLLLSKLAQCTLMRQAIPREERRPTIVYADEFQHFVAPSMETLATEARKYRLGLVVAHQTMAQLSDVRRIESALLGNCHTRVVFRVGDEDAQSLARGFAHFDADVLRSLGRGEAVVRLGEATTDFRMRTMPLASTSDAGARERVLERSRERYGQAPVPAAWRAPAVPSPTAVAAPAPEVPPPGALGEAPAVEAAVATAPNRRRAPPRPQTPEPTTGRGGQMHKYLQHLVKRLAEERGFHAAIEGAAGDGQADVVLTRDALRVAVEISITTDPDHELANLRKCVEAGYGKVIFISPERKMRERLRIATAEALGSHPVAIVGPEDVVVALDALGPAAPAESVRRGYKVKVRRQEVSHGGVASKRDAIAAVVARSLAKGG